MGFYIRKSINLGGGVRLNFSKSGIGISAGIKGFRVGTGPRGNYVHMGSNGLYYRAALGGVNKSRAANKRRQRPSVIVPNFSNSTDEVFSEIDSGAISGLTDSDSQQLIDQINAARKKFPLFTLAILLAFIPDIGIPLAVGVGLLIYYFIDRSRKTVYLVYDIEQSAESIIQTLYDAFESIANCSSVWHVSAEANNSDRKRNAGASTIIRRIKVIPKTSVPKYIKTNVEVPSIPVGKQVLYFFPDRILVYEKNNVACIHYRHLSISQRNQRIIENETIPRDGKVVDHTWQYVNKDGTPDKRYSNNRQRPVLLYTEIDFKSTTGLNERIQLSKPDVGVLLEQQLKRYQSSEILRVDNHVDGNPSESPESGTKPDHSPNSQEPNVYKPAHQTISIPILGYRSQKFWKMMIASMYYGLWLTYLFAAFFIENASPDLMTIVAPGFIFLLVPILFGFIFKKRVRATHESYPPPLPRDVNRSSILGHRSRRTFRRSQGRN